MSTRVVGVDTWEKLVRAALVPVASRPPGSMTYEELCRRFGLGPELNSTRRRINALIEAGLLRRVRGTQLLGGRLQRASFYLPTEKRP